MTSQVDEIKSKLDVAEVVGDYIQLKKAGTSYKATCPFHHEKTPSFYVSPEKQIWHCFGCNEGGDIFTFVEKFEGVEFGEALKILAQKAGVKLEVRETQTETRAGRLKEILVLAADFYHKYLFTEAGSEAREYLKKRGLDKETVVAFELGLAPDSWDAILNFLKTKGFAESEIALTGLLAQKEGKMTHYDRFRNRIMFPINDIYKNVVGFTSRILPSAENDPKAGGKYVNTPQTALYDKSRILYGLDKAKAEIKEKGFAIVVEGNMDVIACHQFGWKNVVASSGTALTEGQLDLIKRHTENLYLSFDIDPAGEIAAKRGIDLALEKGFTVKIIQIPEGCGKDPDECIRKDKLASSKPGEGGSTWEKAIAEAKDVMDYYFDKYLLSPDAISRGQQLAEKKNLSLDEKSKAVSSLIFEISKLQNVVKQGHFIHVLSNISGVKEDILFDELKRVKKSLPKPQFDRRRLGEGGKDERRANLIAGNTRHDLLSERMLALILYKPDKFNFIFQRLKPEIFSKDYYQTLYNQFAEYYNKNKTLDFSGFKAFLAEGRFSPACAGRGEYAKLLDKLALFGEKEFDLLAEKELDKDVVKTADELHYYFILAKRGELGEKIKQTEKSGDKELLKKLLDEFNSLIG